jgi:3-hydroxybutyrate dehydrogenase
VQEPTREIATLGAKVTHYGADMSKPAEIQDMINHAGTTFGGVYILVNNVGIQHVSCTEIFPPERWDTIMSHPDTAGVLANSP